MRGDVGEGRGGGSTPLPVAARLDDRLSALFYGPSRSAPLVADQVSEATVRALVRRAAERDGNDLVHRAGKRMRIAKGHVHRLTADPTERLLAVDRSLHSTASRAVGLSRVRLAPLGHRLAPLSGRRSAGQGLRSRACSTPPGISGTPPGYASTPWVLARHPHARSRRPMDQAQPRQPRAKGGWVPLT